MIELVTEVITVENLGTTELFFAEAINPNDPNGMRL